MKQLLILITSLLSFLNVFAQAKRINAETSIQSVTVFTAGAQISRAATVPVTPGRSEIIFAGLSNQLEQQSVQLRADANITLLSVQTQKDFLSHRKIEQEENELRQKLSSYNDKVQIDSKLLEVYKNEETMLIKNQEIGGQNGVKPSELKEALDLQRQRLTEVFQSQLDLKKKIETGQKEVVKLQAQLNEISKKRDSISYTVIALIDSKETRSIKFGLTYTVKDAGWYPSYDIRVNDVVQPLNVLLNANVFQRSGETWKDVQLYLSTGNPADNTTPSALQPWTVGFYDPSFVLRGGTVKGEAAGRIVTENGEPIAGATVSIKGTHIATQTDANGFFRLQNFSGGKTVVISSVGFEPKETLLKPGYFAIQLKAASMQLQEVVVVGYGTSLDGRAPGVSVNNHDSPKKEEIQPVSVATQYQPTTIVYKIEEKYNLETDGKTTTIGIKNIAIPALYDYFAAPKISASVFLNAKVIDWQNYDLQSGEASLYFEGTFLGKTYLDLAASPDTLSIALGKDNNIQIGRKLIKEFAGKKFIGSSQTESRLYEITIRNNKRTSIHVRVEDQFPVSVNKEISVENREAKEAKIDKDSGIVAWDLNLTPSSEKKLQLSYQVKYPKDRKVVLE